MKILENDFNVSMDTWDDPGDYPNGVAAGPLPSYDYVEMVEGELVVQLEPNDLDPELDEKEQLEELAKEHASIPEGITITAWEIKREGDKVTFEVNDFDASNYQPDTYEPDYDYD